MRPDRPWGTTHSFIIDVDRIVCRFRPAFAGALRHASTLALIAASLIALQVTVSAAVPSAPTALMATSSSGAMILSWSAASSATSYGVYQSTTSGMEGAVPVQTTTSTFIFISGLANLTPVYFKVAGVNSSGTGPMSNEAANEPILESVLHSFGDGTVANDGAWPNGMVQAANGNFYGTTNTGGLAGEGTVFEIDYSGSETVLHSFGDGSVTNDGVGPNAALIQASNGSFYGTTVRGGSAGDGAVFEIDAAGNETVLHSFGDGSVANDGVYPDSALIQASDGSYYGTTWSGGSSGKGTVYRITPSGVVNILHNFDDGTVADDGFNPYAALIQASDGYFYGTTTGGGSVGSGTVFRITPSGVVTILHSFGDGTVADDGYKPYANLLQASDGNFYGTTAFGGSFDGGLVFRITPSGVTSILHNFADGTVPYDGCYPVAGLIQATDGNLYGIASAGGYGNGTAFRMDLSGNVTVLHEFRDGSVANDGTDNGYTDVGFIQGIDGTLYGPTSLGGAAGAGTFFQIDLSATPSTPVAPVELDATAGNAQIVLSWNAAVGAGPSNYNVYRGTAAGSESAAAIATGVTSTGFADTGLANGTSYYYEVAAVNSVGTSAMSNEASAQPSSALPVSPTDLTATPGNATVSLAWTASAGATSYNVYRGTSTSGESATAIAAGITAPTYAGTGLANGTTYFFTVNAVNPSGTSGASNEALATPWYGAPSAPTALSAVSANAQISLTWGPAAGATAYNVYMGTAPGSESPLPVATGVTSTGYTRTGMANGVTYYFTVDALNASGTSGPSNEAFATPIGGPPSAPAGLTATSSSGALILSWSSAASATSYDVYIGTAPGGEGANPVQWTSETSVIISGLTNLQYYYCRVAAVNADGLSPLSREASNSPILETILHYYGDGTVGNDGSQPNGLIEDASGDFYGTTPDGGAAGEGTVFQIDPSGNETILHSFGDGTVPNDGSSPEAGLVLGTDGNFYGATFYGGTTAVAGQSGSGSGTVFRITPAGAVTILHSFGDGAVTNDGSNPQAALIQASDGNFYGTTYYGGSTATAGESETGNGVVFRITPTGAVTILHSFRDGTVANDGANPQAALVQGSDGNLYGTTVIGGSPTVYGGTAFRVTTSGETVILHSFGDGTVTYDGEYPEAALIQASDGNFYGTTHNGGSTTRGAIYSMTPSGAITILHSFLDGTVPFDGTNPEASLIQATDGNLYGTTNGGGYGDHGTAFRVNYSGSVEVLHGFSDGSVIDDGDNPQSALIQATDGSLYSTTYSDSYNGDGCFFRLDAGATPVSPEPPASLTATAGNADVSLSWPPGIGATSYNVYAGTAAGAESATPAAIDITAASYTNTGLTNGVTYFYTVAAVNSLGTSAQSVEASATPEPPAPPAPAGLAATAGTARVSLSWTACTYATSYNVYRATASGAEGTTAAGTASGTTYIDTGLTNGVGYFYTIAAVDGGGTSTQSNEASATPIAAPTGLTATAANTQVSLSWTGGAAATSYNIYRGTASGAEVLFDIRFGTGTSYIDAGLTNGVTYFYEVATVNAGGTSALSNEASATPGTPVPPVPAPPAGLTATAGNALVTLSWTGNNGATSYSIYRATATGAEGRAATATTLDTTFTDTGLTNGVTYFYTVAAVNAGGTSAPSNEASATPSVPAVSGTTHVLWSATNGTLSLWNDSPSAGEFTQNSYGPYPGWSATAIADGPDGLTRVLWTSTGGAASIWSVDTETGEFTQNGFGPYPGWTATALSVGADNTTHVMWSNASGAASVWNYSTGTGAFTQNSYGPYPNWSACGVADGLDGMTRMLWVATNGAASIWDLDNTTGAFSENTFGPYPGWTSTALSVGVDNTTHVLWTNTGGAASVWNYSTSTGTLTQNGYGPYPGWSAARLADSSDGNVQLLWTNTSGAASIWDLNNTTGAYTQNTFGPFGGWTATAVTAYP
ncbi:MAG: choice-of-anchor tandem repeat GloVer-containing protein [Capsulimonadaceae bacterium]